MEQIPILVTGGCGFVGTALVSALLRTNRYAITAIDINPPSPGSPTFTTSVRYVRANVLDPDALQKVFDEARPAIVVHTVGVFPLGVKRYSMKGKEAVFKVNVEGTRNVVEAARECGAKGLVYTSSVTVVLDEMDADFRNVDETWPTGRAGTSYGLSKAAAESLVLSANTPSFATCALRLAPIFGPGDTACLPTIHACISRRATPFILGPGTNLQDYMYIDNAADAHVLAVANLLGAQTAAGEAMFITNGQPVSPRQVCLAAWAHFGHVPSWQLRVPESLAWCLGYVAECMAWLGGGAGSQGVLCRGVVSDACRERYVSIDKAGLLLGYEPRVGLDEGLRISCQHYKNRIRHQIRR